MGIGLILTYLGYAICYWALRAIQGESQDSFGSYLFPTAKTTGGGGSTSPPTPAGSPATTKATAIQGRTATNVTNKIAGQNL